MRPVCRTHARQTWGHYLQAGGDCPLRVTPLIAAGADVAYTLDMDRRIGVEFPRAFNRFFLGVGDGAGAVSVRLQHLVFAVVAALDEVFVVILGHGDSSLWEEQSRNARG